MRLLAAALLLATPALAQTLATTAAERAAIARATLRGKLIYAYDRAAWHGTDDMLAKVPDAAARIGGWVVIGSADAPTVIFYDKVGTEAVYTARFANGRLDGKVLGPGDNRQLGANTLRLIAARKAALATIGSDRAVFACADKPFNTVVLPPETPGAPVAVYVMTPQTSNATIPFGGHFRVEVGLSGQVGSVRAFTRGCLTMPTGSGTEAARSELVFVSHSLDPTPTEIHVFTSLAVRKPVAVGIVPSARMWIVTGTRIDGPLPLPKK